MGDKKNALILQNVKISTKSFFKIFFNKENIDLKLKANIS